MAKPDSLLNRETLAIAAAVPARHRLIVVLVFLATAVFLSACAVDQTKVNRTKADLQALCADPITRIGQAICDRYVQDQPAPVEVPAE